MLTKKDLSNAPHRYRPDRHRCAGVFPDRLLWDEESVAPFFANVQRLVDGAKVAGIPVVQIFHVEGKGAFSEASGLVRTMAPLIIEPDAVFKKPRHSAFVGSGLDVWLTMHGIRRLIISGIRTEQCCETTARHAYDLGYVVDYVNEATLTFPMVDKNGHEWSARDIHDRTELMLMDRFARIVTVEQALAGPAEKIAA